MIYSLFSVLGAFGHLRPLCIAHLCTSLSYEQFGYCVDIARAVNEIAFRTPGMLRREQWEEALESLNAIDPGGVLSTVLDVLAVRLGFLRTRTTTDDWSLAGMTGEIGHRRSAWL